MKKYIETLSDWIESQEVRGYYTFTKDIEKQFPSAGKVYIKTALYRLAAKANLDINHDLYASVIRKESRPPLSLWRVGSVSGPQNKCLTGLMSQKCISLCG